MNDNEFWLKVWKLLIIVTINFIWALTGYWSLDRYFQGHTVITYPATVNSTK